MPIARRAFLKQFALAGSLVGAGALSGCLGDSGGGGGSNSSAPAATTTAESSSTGAAASAPAVSVQAQSTGPVWQPDPTIEFVEGVPSKVSVKQFVQDPNNDPLVVSMQSGTLPPGIMWSPNTAMIEYDGRPLGANADVPTVVSGIVFVADDGKP